MAGKQAQGLGLGTTALKTTASDLYGAKKCKLLAFTCFPCCAIPECVLPTSVTPSCRRLCGMIGRSG